MEKLIGETLLVRSIRLLMVVGFLLVLVWVNRPVEHELYREDIVKRGNLLVGTVQKGTVDMGMQQQLFEMETEEDCRPIIRQVCVTEGQTVQKGDTLYLLEEKEVARLRKALQLELTEAQEAFRVLTAEQKLAKQEAKYAYDSSMAYGGYADREYDATISELEGVVAQNTEDLATAKSILSSYEEQLKGIKADYNTASKVLKNCESSRDKTNRNTNMNKYIEYYELALEAQSNLESLEQKKEELEAKVAQAKENVKSYTEQLKVAKRQLEFGVLEAQETRELRKLAYDTAQETYDVTMGYLEEDAKKQQAVLDAAQQKWDQFNACIMGTAVKSNHNGVIARVSLEPGDVLDSETELVTMYDLEDVRMLVTVEDAAIAKEKEALVCFEAFPDKEFRAKVIEQPGAESVSDGDAGGQIAFALQGDTTGLLQGMTGEVTLIEREVRNVIYVSNHAVKRVGPHSFVTQKDIDGSWIEQEVTTGFSDGKNVEIKEGLSEKDVVCYGKSEAVAAPKTLSDIKITEGQQLVCGEVLTVIGNEITYSVVHELPSLVSDSDAAMQGPIWQEHITVLLPVGAMENFATLSAGDEIALITETLEEETVIVKGYIVGM